MTASKKPKGRRRKRGGGDRHWGRPRAHGVCLSRAYRWRRSGRHPPRQAQAPGRRPRGGGGRRGARAACRGGSEERRVGEKGRSPGWPDHLKKKKNKERASFSKIKHATQSSVRLYMNWRLCYHISAFPQVVYPVDRDTWLTML